MVITYTYFIKIPLTFQQRAKLLCQKLKMLLSYYVYMLELFLVLQLNADMMFQQDGAPRRLTGLSFSESQCGCRESVLWPLRYPASYVLDLTLLYEVKQKVFIVSACVTSDINRENSA